MAGLVNKAFGHAPGLKSTLIGTGIFTAVDVAMGRPLGEALGTQLLYNGFIAAAFPGYMAGEMVGALLYGGTNAYFGSVKPAMTSRRISSLDPSNMNFKYKDTQQAITMRQAAVQAIQGSRMNARSALGGEARLMHRGTPGPSFYY